MKKTILKSILFVGLAVASLSSCTTMTRSMREPNVRVELQKSDFTLSDQVSAEATSVKILGIDFSRLFTKKMASIEGGAPSIGGLLSSIPVVGNIATDKTSSYSLYELMKANEGYDVVFYPQYETKKVSPIGINFIFNTTTVKTTARLGKLIK